MKDFYALLGVAPDATAEQIRRAYRDRAQAAMWDRPRFVALGEAFEVLKDPARRAAYDRQRRVANESPAAEAAPPLTAAGTAGGGAAVFTAEPPQQTPPAAATANRGERTATAAGEPCPACGTGGPPDDGFCRECGFLLGSLLGPETNERPLPYLTDEGGRRFALRTGENTVGREGADVSLGDRTVSRRHARVTVEPDGDLWLEDLGSTNGTQRAGRSVPPHQRAALGDGTQIQFGAVKLTVTRPDAPAALPLPEATSEGREPEPSALPAPPPAETPAFEPAPEPLAKLVGEDGQVYALTAATTTFGRRSTNDFVLNSDPYISGAHAQIVCDNGGFHVVDLGSTNGTQVRGVRIAGHAPISIHDGDEIVLGRTMLRFHSRAAAGASRSPEGVKT
jgi:pSer/pThr/pTyr-binding forkhead associated (FHA) protein